MAPKAKAAAAAPAQPAAKAKPEAKKKPAKKEENPEDTIPKVPQPDADAFKEAVAKVTEDIDKLNKEQNKLTEKINERSGGKTEFFAQKAELRRQLDEISEKMDQLQARRDEISKAFGEKVQENREQKQQLNKMKKSIGYNTETEIDDRIASIEFKLWTDTISLKEEKQYLAEIAELKRNRPKVSKVRELEESVTSADPGTHLKLDKNQINEEMAIYREQKKGISEKLRELVEARKEQLGDLPDTIKERDELSKKIAEKVKERNEIRDKYREEEKLYYAYQGELRKLKQERQQKERADWQAELDRKRKLKEAEKLDEQPHIDEITLIEQTILFCKGLTASKNTEVTEQAKETVIDNPEGTEVLTKKEDRDEYYFVPTAKGKKNKAKAKGGKAEGTSKAIKHNAMTFGFFSQLKLDAPITTDDIPGTLEKLEAQLQDFKDKVKKWEVTRDERKRKILDGADVDEEPKEEEVKEEEDKGESKEDSKEEEAEAES